MIPAGMVVCADSDWTLFSFSKPRQAQETDFSICLPTSFHYEALIGTGLYVLTGWMWVLVHTFFFFFFSQNHLNRAKFHGVEEPKMSLRKHNKPHLIYQLQCFLSLHDTILHDTSYVRGCFWETWHYLSRLVSTWPTTWMWPEEGLHGADAPPPALPRSTHPLNNQYYLPIL